MRKGMAVWGIMSSLFISILAQVGQPLGVPEEHSGPRTLPKGYKDIQGEAVSLLGFSSQTSIIRGTPAPKQGEGQVWEKIHLWFTVPTSHSLQVGPVSLLAMGSSPVVHESSCWIVYHLVRGESSASLSYLLYLRNRFQLRVCCEFPRITDLISN